MRHIGHRWGAGRLPAQSNDGAPLRIPWLAVSLLTAAVLVISAASVTTSLVVNGAGILVAAVILLIWLWRERSTDSGVLPAATFGPDRRLGLVYLTMAALVIASTVEVFVPYFGQHLQGLGPLAAGFLGAVMAAGWTAGSVAFSGVRRRKSQLIATAPVCSMTGLIVLVLVGPLESHALITVLTVALGLLLVGLGVGAAWPHLLTDVLQLAGDRDQGLAGASATTVQLTATAVGSAIAGTVTNIVGFTDPSHTADAARWLFAIFLLPAVVALATAWSVRR